MENRWRKKDNELILNHNKQYDMQQTIEHFVFNILRKFKKNDKVVVLTNLESLPLVNMAIDESKHMGYLQDMRSTEMSEDNYGNKIEQVRIPLQLISAIKELKKDKDRKYYD